jgi:hypothetical protein
MYIFNRMGTAAPGKLPEATAGAIAAAAMASEVSGVDVYAWAVRFGAPGGSFNWSARFETQSELHAATAKLAADAAYVEMSMALAANFAGPSQDGLGRLVAGTPAESPSAFYAITTASMAAGKYAEAVAFGARMQEFVNAETGMPTAFLTATYGGFADVTWLTGADSMDDIDALAGFEATNARYHEMVQEAGGLFIDGSGQNGLIEKIN